MFNRAAEAEPRCQRNSPRARHRNIAEIESDHSETIALQQQVGDFQHLPELRFPALDLLDFSAAIRRLSLPELAEGCLREGYFSPQRTHSKRLISMPAAAADAGSNASLASTSAQTSPRWVARASAKSNTLVLPDDAVPQISVRQPRARPPVSESSCGMPLETISGAGRTSRREAGTTAASLGMAPTWAKISAVFRSAVFSAVERGEDGGEKIKGRPMAADEKTGEADILSRNCQGTRRAGISPGEAYNFRFLFAYMSIPLAACCCQAIRLES